MDTQTMIKATLLATLSFLIWRILRPVIVKSPLSRVPGPPKASWWKGKPMNWWLVDASTDVRVGNFDKVFDRRGWNYHRELTEKYGGAVRISALLGVSAVLLIVFSSIHICIRTSNCLWQILSHCIISSWRTNTLMKSPMHLSRKWICAFRERRQVWFDL